MARVGGAEVNGSARLSSLSLVIIAAILFLIAMHLAATVFMPLAFALFIVALAAPLQRWLDPRVGRGISLVLTVIAVLFVVGAFASVVGWSVGRIGAWALSHLSAIEKVYLVTQAVLAERGLELAQILPARFDPMWVISPVLGIIQQTRAIGGFLLLVFVFAVLGLAELDGTSRRVKRIEAEQPWLRLSELGSGLSRDYGRYMGVRFVVSVVDGILCYAFFHLVGLEEPAAWAVLIFAFNFIPFIGPLIAAVGIAIFTAAQFGSLSMVLLLVVATVGINFILGSFIEPLVAGSTLSMSAVLVLLSVFLWGLIWGIPGAFLGVQISIVVLAVLRMSPDTAWLAELLSSGGERALAVPGPAESGAGEPGGR
jgi:predicted PurR-regulated permease PerM